MECLRRRNEVNLAPDSLLRYHFMSAIFIFPSPHISFLICVEKRNVTENLEDKPVTIMRGTERRQKSFAGWKANPKAKRRKVLKFALFLVWAFN